MAQLTPKDWAQALLKVTMESDQQSLKLVIKRFASLLVEQGQVARLDQIINQFRVLYNHQFKISEGEVVSRWPLTHAELDTIIAAVEKELGQTVELTNRIDPTGLGGLEIIMPDLIIDGRLERRLTDLKQLLINS